MRPPIFGIAGWKNSGKTTLTCALVAEFRRRGFRVSTVKHAHHVFDVDRRGADSFCHRRAGAGEVAVVSSRRWALMHELSAEEVEPDLDEILARLSPCDLVLIEGYKSAPHAKIEVRRRAAGDAVPLAPADPSVVAVAADHAVPDCPVPVFDLDDVEAIADLIAARVGLTAPAARGGSVSA